MYHLPLMIRKKSVSRAAGGQVLARDRPVWVLPVPHQHSVFFAGHAIILFFLLQNGNNNTSQSCCENTIKECACTHRYTYIQRLACVDGSVLMLSK